jgi:two-component system response regulator LytT
VNELGLRALVVDDDAPARDELVFLLRQLPNVSAVGEAEDADECLARLDRDDFDALFLDVRMPRLDGLTLARTITRMSDPPAVVFVTAFEEYAVEAFGLDAVDYLLKPVRPERVEVTMRRLAARHRGSATAPATEALEDRLPVVSAGQILLLPVDEIRVAAMEGDRVYVHTPQGRYQTRLTLFELEARVKGHGFLRVHRQFVVNLRHVVSVGAFFNGTYLLKLTGLELTVPVSRRHAAELRAAIRL